jgi:hypothetical protein
VSPRNKPRTAYRERSENRKPGDAHTIMSFCASNKISLSKFFDLKRRGLGPREIELDGRVIITPEAESDWRRERELETTAKRARTAQSAADKSSSTGTPERALAARTPLDTG